MPHVVSMCSLIWSVSISYSKEVLCQITVFSGHMLMLDVLIFLDGGGQGNWLIRNVNVTLICSTPVHVNHLLISQTLDWYAVISHEFDALEKCISTYTALKKCYTFNMVGNCCAGSWVMLIMLCMLVFNSFFYFIVTDSACCSNMACSILTYLIFELKFSRLLSEQF